MPDPIIRLSLVLDCPADAVEPGAKLGGVVRAESAAPWEAIYFEVVASWLTSGKGTSDREVAAALALAPKGSTVPAAGEFPFLLQLPEMPWTYQGTVLKIYWMLGVYAKPRGADEAHLEMGFAMRPPAAPPAPLPSVPIPE
ncbi:hypothetical protein HZA57_04115 [Candidatus Poribacteria bacterium]|nr:hypothetical protein [Candidatus Poribacteria bacterium]